LEKVPSPEDLLCKSSPIFKNFYTKKEDKVCADLHPTLSFLVAGKFLGRVRETFFSKKVSRENFNSSMPALEPEFFRRGR
jgi:hypothetical protein